MTAVEIKAMNVELWQSIATIADNESLMNRLARYAKKLAKEKEDPTLMSKEEFFAMLAESKKGTSKRFDNVEELDSYIRSL